MRKSGFTLVELSIVLVIIGLLVGGVLVGQSLIDSARINRLVSDLRQYEVATVQFRNKFKKYPGDSQHFTPPGNGDDALGYGANGVNTCAAAPNAALLNIEANQVWAHLSQSGMLSKSYAAFSPEDDCGGIHNKFYNNSANAGLVYPYTELSGGIKVTIYTYKISKVDNFSFEFTTNSLGALAIENKLGSKNYVNQQQIGLVSSYGVGMCDDGSLTIVFCTDPSAAYGNFRYFLAPP